MFVAESDTAPATMLDLSGSLSLRAQRGRRGQEAPSRLMEATRAALEAATARGDTHIVLVSSAIVYGAWENNPVPLEETRTLRPRPEIPDAVALAAAEAMVDGWRRESPGRTATILRPVTVVRPGAPGPMVADLARAVALTPSLAPAPAQFLDHRDLESAVELCRRLRPDAVLNVAPPGMIPGERVRELAPGSFTLPLPGGFTEVFEGWRASVAAGTGALAHARHPWVVSSDRLSKLGWEADVSNEQAFVGGTTEGRFASLTARRRQELALVGSALAVAVASGGVLSWWRRARHR